MLRYLSTGKNPKVLNDIKKFFSGIENNSLIPFVQEDNKSNEIRVWLIEPDELSDIVNVGTID